MPPTSKKAPAKTTAAKKTSSKKTVLPKATAEAGKNEPGLALSDLHLRLAGLEAENEKLLKLIGRKRKEIDNFVTDAQGIAQEVLTKGSPFMSKIEVMDTEIHKIFTKIFTTRKMGKHTAAMVEDVYFYLQSSDIISINPDHRPRSFMEEMMEQMFGKIPDVKMPQEPEEQEAGNYYDSMDEDAPTDKIDRVEARKIRQTFLRLAAVFHPDKLPDESKKAEYEEVMKEVNLAYQRGDLATLLKIERQYEVGETIDLNNADDLTLRCRQLDRENELLKEQQLAVQQELRQVKASEPGQMLKQYRKMRKYGIDPLDEMVAEAKINLENIETLRDFVQSFLDKKITVERFKRGPKLKRMDGREFLDEDDLSNMVVTIMDYDDF
jgi:hypothetical protein